MGFQSKQLFLVRDQLATLAAMQEKYKSVNHKCFIKHSELENVNHFTYLNGKMKKKKKSNNMEDEEKA